MVLEAQWATKVTRELLDQQVIKAHLDYVDLLVTRVTKVLKVYLEIRALLDLPDQLEKKVQLAFQEFKEKKVFKVHLVLKVKKDLQVHLVQSEIKE